MDKKKPKSHWFLTKYRNSKRMYNYNMRLIEADKTTSSSNLDRDIDDFVKTIKKDEQQYTKKANKQMKFAKWGSLFGLVGPVLAMSAGFFIFSLATAMLPGQFLITTGIAIASALTLFGALPRWLAHRSHKRVRLAQKYKGKVDSLNSNEAINVQTNSQIKTEAEEKADKKKTRREELETEAVAENEESQGFVKKEEMFTFGENIKKYKPVIFGSTNNEEESQTLIPNNITETEIVENTDTRIEDAQYNDSVITLTDVKEKVVEVVDDATTETNNTEVFTSNTASGETSAVVTETKEASEVATTESKTDEVVASATKTSKTSSTKPKQLGRYKFEVISTRADKNGKGAISTKVVAFSANSREAFLEKMRKFCSNRSKNKKRLDTEVEQSLWLSEGEYPATLQFKVTDIFHQGKTIVSKVYSNTSTTQKGENIETFMRVIDSLRQTWSTKFNKSTSTKQNAQEFTTDIGSEAVTPNTYTDVSGAKFSVPNEIKQKAQTFTVDSSSEVVTPNTYTDVSGADFSIEAKTGKKDEYAPDTYTDVSGADFSIEAKANNEDEYTPSTYTDVSGANFTFPKKPVKVKIVSDYMEWNGKKNGKELTLEDLKTSAKTKTIDVEEKKSHTLVLENDEPEKKDDKIYYIFNEENELTH